MIDLLSGNTPESISSITESNVSFLTQRRKLLTASSKTILADGYYKCEYIDSEGRYYIDTGFNPNQDTRVVMDIEIKFDEESYIFGATRLDYPMSFAASHVTEKYLKWYYNNSNVIYSLYESSLNKRVIIDANKDDITYDGYTVSSIDYSNFDITCSLYLLQNNNAGRPSNNNPINAKLYSCQIYDNNNIVRDYVPCVNEQGVYGLYDLINNEFYELKEYVKNNNQYDFPFKAEAQSLWLSKGTYKLEVWGAQGGVFSDNLNNRGGYACGTITLPSDTQVFVYTGGQPNSVTSGNSGDVTPGGFNGGGASKISYYNNVYTYGQGGGGGTDIRINEDSLYNRVIVAGGGAGASDEDVSFYVYGGGNNGGNGYQQHGGTQTTGGSSSNFGTFGKGADVLPSSTNYKFIASGGGGGWYGGGAYGSGSSSGAYVRYRCGGGSGFVWTIQSSTPSDYKLNSTYYLTDTQNTGGNELILSPYGESNIGNKGNGYARITKLSDNIPVVVDITWSFTNEPWTEYGYGGAADGKYFISNKIQDNGSTTIRCTFKGVTSITFCCHSSNEANYDYLTVGELDTVCTRNQFKHKVDNTSSWLTYDCTTEEHYVEFCYSKDGSQSSGDDQAEIFISSYT